MQSLFDGMTRSNEKVPAPICKPGVLRTVRKGVRVLAIPFVGLAYFLAMPFIFVFFVGSILIYWTVGAFGWRPSAAYLAGRDVRMREKK